MDTIPRTRLAGRCRARRNHDGMRNRRDRHPHPAALRKRRNRGLMRATDADLPVDGRRGVDAEHRRRDHQQSSQRHRHRHCHRHHELHGGQRRDLRRRDDNQPSRRRERRRPRPDQSLSRRQFLRDEFRGERLAGRPADARHACHRQLGGYVERRAHDDIVGIVAGHSAGQTAAHAQRHPPTPSGRHHRTVPDQRRRANLDHHAQNILVVAPVSR